jgi:predicted MFS family arabinose efflux permease
VVPQPRESDSRPTFRSVLAVPEFRALWASEVLSVVGDRLALVALTLFVYNKTGSPLLAAATYAAGYVPWVLGGFFLGAIADRKPRRSVMVTCDVVRTFTVGLMLIPGVPLAGLVGLLFITTMFAPPFESARASLTPDILGGEKYVLGTAIIQTTFLFGQVIGAAGGGIAVTYLHVRPSLAIDAATFAVSALLIRFGTRKRPPAASGEQARERPLANMAAGFRLVFGDKALRTLIGFGWLVVFYTVPEGIAAPFAHALHGGSKAAGAVLASVALATAIVTPLFSRALSPRRRVDWMGPLAVMCNGSLVLIALHPSMIVSLVIFSASSAFGAYQIAANTAFVVRVPNERRSQAFAIANMGVIVGQGLTFVAAGAACTYTSPSVVIGVAGGLGMIVAVILTAQWRHVSPPGGRHAARRRPSYAASVNGGSRVPLRGS